MKRILFLLGYFGIGGVERVTVTLANAMAQRGDIVWVVMFTLANESLINEFDPRIKVLCLNGRGPTLQNCLKLRTILRTYKIEYIVNQWCLPASVTFFLRCAAVGLGIKLLAVHHTMPSRNARMMGARHRLMKCFWRVVSGISLNVVYHFSDAYVLLSSSYIPLLKHFAWVSSSKKMFVIANPVVADNNLDKVKEKSIIYVGRLTAVEKRVDRVIDIWHDLSKRLPDWHLDILGDGPDRQSLEKRAEGMERIIFHGFQPPNHFYAKARFLLLTSDFEGFPMTLVECMSYGCIPIVYASFTSVYDIARGGEVLLPPPFDANKFVKSICEIVEHKEVMENMEQKARTITNDFGVKAILRKWDQLFDSLKGS